jgi:hypothetical protein
MQRHVLRKQLCRSWPRAWPGFCVERILHTWQHQVHPRRRDRRQSLTYRKTGKRVLQKGKTASDGPESSVVFWQERAAPRVRRSQAKRDAPGIKHRPGDLLLMLLPCQSFLPVRVLIRLPSALDSPSIIPRQHPISTNPVLYRLVQPSSSGTRLPGLGSLLITTSLSQVLYKELLTHHPRA